MDVLIPALAIAVLYSFLSLRVLRQYERGVTFFLGRFWGTKGPGLIFLPAGFASQKRVSLRIVAMDIPPQDVITRDNVSEKVNAVLKKIIDERTDMWGIEVSAVEVKDVDLPDQMKRAMARQAEAERERRAKVIAAQGELQASETLAQAAHTLASEPTSLQLRYLQTVTEIAAENNSTTIFPIPIELFRPFLRAPAAKSGEAADPSEPSVPALSAGDLTNLISQLRI